MSDARAYLGLLKKDFQKAGIGILKTKINKPYTSIDDDGNKIGVCYYDIYIDDGDPNPIKIHIHEENGKMLVSWTDDLADIEFGYLGTPKLVSKLKKELG